MARPLEHVGGRDRHAAATGAVFDLVAFQKIEHDLPADGDADIAHHATGGLEHLGGVDFCRHHADQQNND